MNKFKMLDDGLIINKISKSYGNKEVVRDVSINIKRGQVVGLLGPNCAGKTTTLSLLTGLFPPSSGDATVNGSNLSVTLPGSLTGNLEPGLYQMFVAVFSEEIASLSERQIDIEILG